MRLAVRLGLSLLVFTFGCSRQQPDPPRVSFSATLVTAAAQACDAAFRQPAAVHPPRPVLKQANAAVLLMMKQGETPAATWGVRNGADLNVLPFLEATRSEAVRYLTCVRTTDVPAGSYYGGAPAYRVRWELRLVSWPDTTWLDAGDVTGGDPPVSIPQGWSKGVGDVPYRELTGWLVARTDDSSLVIGHDEYFPALTVSPDQRLVAIGGSRGSGARWVDRSTGVGTSFPADLPSASALAFSSDGRRLAAAAGTEIHLADVSTRSGVATLSGVPDEIRALTFTPDDRRLIALHVAGDTRVRVSRWDAHAARLLSASTVPIERCSSVALSSDGRVAAIGTMDDQKTVFILDVESGAVVRKLRPGVSASAIALSRDGRLVAVSAATGDFTESRRLAQVWDVRSGAKVNAFEWVSKANGELALSPDGRTLAIGTEAKFPDPRGLIHLLDLGSGQARTLRGHGAVVRGLVYSPDGKWLVSAAADGVIKFWPAGAAQ